MDGISTPDTSAASVEVASSSEAVASAATPDAVSGGQDTPTTTQGTAPAGESSTPASEIEFPDDAALQAMQPADRQSNWQQLRQAYASAKTDAAAYAQHKEAIEQISALGGFERIQQQAELGGLLFSSVEDPNTGQVSFTAAPFVERLATESPETLGEVTMLGLNEPSPWNPEETIGHTWFKSLGLNPELLETYRAIQSPQDAKQLLAQSGAVTAEELSAIPEAFHDAYKSLTPKQREELTYADEETKNAFLQNAADALEARQFIAQQKAQAEEQKQQAAAQFQQRVEARGAEIAQAVQQTLLTSARQKLQAEASFSADEGVNGALHNEAINWAAQRVLSDPGSQADSQRAEQLYTLSARAELSGDKFKAAEFKLQADNLARKLEGRFRNALTERVAFWSGAFGTARTAQQQQVQAARPRAEIGASNQAAPSARPQPNSHATPRDGFGFSQQQIDQYAAMIRARQMGQ